MATTFERLSFFYGCFATVVGAVGYVLILTGRFEPLGWPVPVIVGIYLLHFTFYVGQRHEFRRKPQAAIRVTLLRLRVARGAMATSFGLVLMHTAIVWWFRRGDEDRLLWALKSVIGSLYLMMGTTISASAGLCLHNVLGPRLMAWRDPHVAIASLWARNRR
jgi:hypothetical protein